MYIFEYTRSSGMRLAYEVRVLANQYIISHEGIVLKEALCPLIVGGNVSPEEAIKIFAIRDIENLVDMREK